MCCSLNRDVHLMKKKLILSLITLLTSSVLASESEPASRLVESYTSAKALERVEPKFPRRAARKASDGWVQLSYVIDTEGNVRDIVPMNNVGDSAFVDAAINAVKQWKFEPAVANGEAIEQCDNTLQMDFILSNGAGVSRKFNTLMFNGRNALSEGNLEGAQAELNKMDNMKRTNMTEVFWRNHLAISLYNQTGELEKKHVAVVRARRSLNAINLEDDQKAKLHSYLLQEEFAYLANHRYYASAMSTFDKLKKVDQKTADLYLDGVKKVEALIAGNNPIFVDAEINKSGRWNYDLARRAFTISEINGRLDKLEIRCSRKFRSFTISEQSQWKIPESWGKCNIHVLGEEKSKFKLVEVKA